MKRIQTLLITGLATLLLGGAWAMAQDAPTDPVAAPDAKVTEVVGNQKFLKAQFDKLMSKMVDVAVLLEKTDPESSKALKEAVAQAKGAFIAEDMDKVAEALEKGLAGVAANTQEDVIEQLKKVLETIRSGRDIDADQIKRMERWAQELAKMIDEQRKLEVAQRTAENAKDLRKEMQALKQQLKSVVDEQKKLLGDTQKQADKGDKNLQKLAEMHEAIKEMIAKQEKLRDATDNSPVGRLAAQGEQQRKLAQQASDLAKQLDKASKDPAMSQALAKSGADGKSCSKASSCSAKASQSMSDASQSLTQANADSAAKAQDKALDSLKQAQAAMAQAMAKAAQGTPSGQLAKRQKDLENKTANLKNKLENLGNKIGEKTDSSNLDKAADEMSKAGEKIKGQNAKGATDHQKQAIKELEGKQALKLADLERRLEIKASQDPKKQGDRQENLANKAGEMADEMAKKDEKQPDGSPGAKSMGQASKSASSAAGKMKNSKGGGASDDQKKAADEMQKAKQELDDAIAQAKKEQQEKALLKIADMLKKMLETQKDVSLATKDVDPKRGADGSFQRPEVMKLGELSTKEGGLGEEAGKIVKMLTDEGSTAVFPEMMKEVENNLRDLQNMLADKQTGQLTQAVQGEVERNLDEMIKALQQEAQRRKKKGGGGGGGGGGGKAPLVPPVAELKMLRTLQLQINNRTLLVAAQKAAKSLPEDLVKSQHEKLANSQLKVQKIANDLQKKGKKQGGPQ